MGGFFDKEDREKQLMREDERLELETKVQDKRALLAEKKRLEREARKTEGKNWAKVLGVVKKIKPDLETVHDFYGVNPDLRAMNDIRKLPRR